MLRSMSATGLLVGCAVILLSQPIWAVQGGCCLPDGSCQESTRDDVCAQLGGTKPGNSTTDPCSVLECPQPEGGACAETADCMEGIGLECLDGICSSRKMAPVTSPAGLALLVGALAIGGGFAARRMRG